MLPKRFHIYKNGENVRKCQSMDLEWNGTGGFQKCRSRESIRVWKDIGRLWETSEMSECGIGKHWSMDNVGKYQKHQSYKSYFQDSFYYLQDIGVQLTVPQLANTENGIQGPCPTLYPRCWRSSYHCVFSYNPFIPYNGICWLVSMFYFFFPS